MIKAFESKEEFEHFINKKKCMLLGKGSEGNCYLGKDGLAYKIIRYNMYDRRIKDYITDKDYKLKHFAFPIDFYTDINHDEIYGYSTNAFIGDIFFDNELLLCVIDPDKMVEAYYELVKDIKVISDDNIFIYDALNNLLFNNKQYMLIDTLDYCLIDDPYERNINMINDAITTRLRHLTKDKEFYDTKTIEDISKLVKKHVKRNNYY